MTQVLAPTTPSGRLDPYAGGEVTETPRITPLALISAGYRAEPRAAGERGLPRASRPGDAQQIHLHDPLGMAPELAHILEQNNWDHLTIAFPLDNPRAFVSQIFTRYSATRLEMYGDGASITYIDNRPQTLESNRGQPMHRVFPAGSPEYDRLVRTCKADTRIFFCLAEWTDQGSEVIFPDGLGVYAIRTTSRHSVRNILGTIAYTAQFTRGRIAGLPFTLRIVHRPNVTGPDGTQRTVPLWAITTQPPAGVRLGSRTFRSVATQALREGAQLMLPTPSSPTLEDLEAEGPVDEDITEPDAEQLELMAAGGLCDANHWTKTWHAMARGVAWTNPDTEVQYALDSDDGRAAFLQFFTAGAYGSLSAYLREATDEQAAELVGALGSARTAMHANRYDDIFGREDSSQDARSEPTAPSTAETTSGTSDSADPAF